MKEVWSEIAQGLHKFYKLEIIFIFLGLTIIGVLMARAMDLF